jgi:hypothetical protein
MVTNTSSASAGGHAANNNKALGSVLPLSSAKALELRDHIGKMTGPIATANGVVLSPDDLMELILDSIATHVKFGWYASREIDTAESLAKQAWRHLNSTTSDSMKKQLKAIAKLKKIASKNQPTLSSVVARQFVQADKSTSPKSNSSPTVAPANEANRVPKAPANVAELGQKLANLQTTASVVSHQIITTNKAFYEHLAELYMWWREAKQVPGYLAAEYATIGKKHKTKVKHGINFAPLFWLTWGFDNGLTDDKTGRWSRVMNKLHGKYESEQQYKTDSVPKLANFIDQSGGVDGLVDYGKKEQGKTVTEDDDRVDDDTFDIPPADAVPIVGNGKTAVTHRASTQPTLSMPEMLAQLYGSANDYYGAISTPTTINLNATIPLTDDCMGLVLVRKVGNAYQLVGASNDETIVKPVAMQTYLQDFTALPRSIRTIIEIVSTQCLPKRIQSFYKALADDAAKGTASAGKKSVRRLMYLNATGEFLLSPIRAEAGVVTYAKPTQPVLENATADVFVPTRNRRAMENKLIAGHDFNLFVPSNLIHVPPYTASSNLASHAIRLQNRFAASDYMHLEFWPFYDSMPEPRGQLTANGLKAGSGTWHATLSLSWFRKFSLEFISKWINSHGNHIKRAHQNVFKVEFSKFALAVHFVYREGQFESNLTVDLDTAPTSGKSIAVHLLTKDFAVAMQAVADLGVATAIEVDVDSDGMALHFGTTAANYRIIIPTCTISGIRSSWHFAHYEPQPFVIDAFEDYNDQAEGDFDDGD